MKVVVLPLASSTWRGSLAETTRCIKGAFSMYL